MSLAISFLQGRVNSGLKEKINEKIIMEESGDYRNGRNNDDDDWM